MTPSEILTHIEAIAAKTPDDAYVSYIEAVAKRMLRARTCGEHGGVYIWGINDEAVAKLLVLWMRSRSAAPLGEHPTDATRHSDMDPDERMKVMQQDDGDMIVSLIGRRGMPSVEFCTLTGGGRSPRTRKALQDLMVAMAADEKEHPSPGAATDRIEKAK